MTGGSHASTTRQERPWRPNGSPRAWVGLRCLNGRHEACRDRRRCDCECHSFVTGALRLHMEPA